MPVEHNGCMGIDQHLPPTKFPEAHLGSGKNTRAQLRDGHALP